MKFKNSPWNSRAPYLALLLLAVVYFAWAPFSSARFSDNEGTYTSISQELERGAKLYRDTWDNKPPFLYAQYLALRRVMGTTPGALRVYVLLVHVFDAFLLFLLLVRAGREKATAWVAAFAYAAFMSSPDFQPYLAEADLLMQPFLLGSICMAFSEGQAGWITSGVLWALAFFTKQSALFLLPMFLPIFKGRPFRCFLWFGVGAVLTSVSISLPFFMDARMGMLMSAIFGIGRGMSGAYMKEGWSLFSTQEIRDNIIFDVGGTALAVYGVALFMCAVYLLNRTGDRFFKWFWALWLGLGLLTCALRGYFFTYYFFVLIPPLAVGFALGMEVLKKSKFKLLLRILAKVTANSVES